jgi:pimeloyl-ACP methyl ester carboxylesterase
MLILHGDDDPLVPLVNARAMAAVMPRAQLRVIPRAGHLFLFDEPDSVVEQLHAFLGRR